MRAQFPRLDQPKLAFRNRHDLTFEDTSSAWGFHTKAISQGMAMADLDNDGDLDLAINDLNSEAEIFRTTDRPARGRRLKASLPIRADRREDPSLNGAVPVQSQEMICGGRYLSCDDSMRVFAAGSTTNRIRLEVTWRSGRHSVVQDVRANRLYEIAEAGAAALTPATPSEHPWPAIAGEAPFNLKLETAADSPLFEDVSSLLHHTHHDEDFDDFARQPLLPRKLSQLGPGLAWADLDEDGLDDLIIGSGRGGRLAVYHNAGGRFTPMTAAPLDQPITRDQAGIVVWPKAPGDLVILAGSANYEDGLAVGACVRQFDLANHRIDDSLPGQESSTGPLALADIDGDGDLDLFVGGRVFRAAIRSRPRPCCSGIAPADWNLTAPRA